jgi:hypothetical protein
LTPAAEGGIGHHHVEAVFLLNIGEVFGERVGVDDVGRLDAVQNHVHDRDDVGERLLLLAVEGAFLENLVVFGGEAGLRFHIVERLAQEAGRADGVIGDLFADPGFDHLDDGANERARGIILAAVAAGVAHPLDFFFVKLRQFVLFGLGTEAQFVDVVDDFAEVVARLNLVFDLAEDFADLVFDGVRPGRLLLEAMKVGEKLAIDEIAQIVAGLGLVMVDLAVYPWGQPRFPSDRACRG